VSARGISRTSLGSGIVAPPDECIEHGVWLLHEPMYEFSLTAPDEATADRVREDMRLFGMSFTMVGSDGNARAIDPRTVRVQVAGDSR
jgi:hypothetical protein